MTSAIHKWHVTCHESQHEGRVPGEPESGVREAQHVVSEGCEGWRVYHGHDAVYSPQQRLRHGRELIRWGNEGGRHPLVQFFTPRSHLLQFP